MKKKQKSK